MGLCGFLNALLANIVLLPVQYLSSEEVRDEGLRRECRFFHAQEQSAFQTEEGHPPTSLCIWERKRIKNKANR